MIKLDILAVLTIFDGWLDVRKRVEHGCPGNRVRVFFGVENTVPRNEK